MPKIRARTGVSLADIYDIEGSIVGVDELVPQEVQTVHEMGHTIFSERFGLTIARASSGAIAQSTAWNNTLTPNAQSFYRILGIAVLSDQPGRVSNCVISIRSATLGREVPLWVFVNADGASTIQLVENGGAVAAAELLNGTILGLPGLGAAAEQRDSCPEIVFRGLTTAFGAGTATQIVLVQLGLASPAGGLSAYGLPMPSW